MKKIILRGKNGYEFPVLLYCPKEKSQTLVIHLAGVGGIKEMTNLFGIDEEKNNFYFLSYDYRGCGESKLRSSRLNCRYVKDLYLLIESIKTELPNIKKIYITGESWGGNIASLFQKKYPNCVKGYVIWNAPVKVVNNTTKVKIQKNDDTFFSITMKTIFTIITNINTKLNPPGVEELTDNKIFVRSVRVGRANGTYTNSKMILAAWLSMMPAWRYMKKHFKNDLEPPVYLIQSSEDMYYKKNIKMLNKIKTYKAKKNTITLARGGKHILSVEKKSYIIWEKLNELISKTSH